MADKKPLIIDTNGRPAEIATGDSVAIANGGTGQTSATSAFDALAPTTTTGDLIYHNGTDNVRLAIGSSANVLTVTGGVPVWAAPSGGASLDLVSYTFAGGL